MKNIRCYLLGVSVAIAIFGCKKNNNERSLQPSAAEILTERPWKLLSYGFDLNKNGMIDPNEESIRDCENDNTYMFNKDGSGVFYENSKICDGNDPVSQFNWTLKNNDTVLDFIFGTAYIVKLSTGSLYITDSNSDQVKLLLIYGR